MSDASGSKMTRGNRASRERRSTTIDEPLEQNDSEDDASVHAVENDSYVKRGNTPSQKRWTSSEDSGRPYNREIKTSFLGKQDTTEDTETVSESPDVKNNDKSRRSEVHAHGKARYSDIRESDERITSRSVEGRRRKRSKRIERRKFRERSHTTDRDHDRTDTGSSIKHYSGEDNFTDKSRERKRKKIVSQADDHEVPITEILKKAQENARTKYEEPVPLPELTTDTIYIQGRSGFSAVKIGGSRRALKNDMPRATEGRKDRDSAETPMHTLIKVAITAQKFWRGTGLVYQGLLGGMALLHFIMIYLFFNTSMEFLSNYSSFSEVYTNMFSFLIALCVISIFDKFDLARLDMDHLREIYMDHTKTAIAIPLYLLTFGLHQASLKIDDQLALIHYRNINESVWPNNTAQETLSEELQGWQKITMSKDLLAVLAWLCVALGTRDNMLLMHLESMEQYASDAEFPR
ncbi:uncharacterized protein [Anoplolepis gracilipes]|uniref:uncharacterized protein n=1 Tax=Anoplolepis gracilipes TaxID=354296 RepID=UPI003BA04D99